MDTRVAVISIIVENPAAIEELNLTCMKQESISWKNGNSVPGEGN